MKTRKKSVDKDGMYKAKYVSYIEEPLQLPNVIHVGVNRDTIYYFGYSYSSLLEKIDDVRSSLLNSVQIENKNKMSDELNKAKNGMKDLQDKIDKNNLEIDLGKIRHEEEKALRIDNLTLNKKRGVLNATIARIKANLKKLIKKNDKDILKELYDRSPIGHTVTNKGLMKGIDVPLEHTQVMEEIFIAYEKKNKAITIDMFKECFSKYNYNNTTFYLHGSIGKELHDIINRDKLNPFHGRTYVNQNLDEENHIVPNLFGKIHNRLSIYQGNSFYKYFIDKDFFNVTSPYLFRIPYSHVLIKPDLAIDEDGYYNIFLMDYSEKNFQDSSKEAEELYNQEEVEDADLFRPIHEYVGASEASVSLVKIGIKSPPLWLQRLLRAMANYDSTDFLMCRAEEFTDQWFLLLMEHFTEDDYDMGNEYSPFLGSPGMFLLTGQTQFRVFKPRWLTLTLTSLLNGHYGDGLRKTDMLFLETGKDKNTLQRTPRGYMDERNIFFSCNTQYGEVNIREKINFPMHSIWNSIKNNLISATVNVSKQPKEDKLYTSTELRTKEYSFEYLNPFTSIASPYTKAVSNDHHTIKGVVYKGQPYALKDTLRASGQQTQVHNLEKEFLLQKKMFDTGDINHGFSTDFSNGYPMVTDANAVPLTKDIMEDVDNKLTNEGYGEVVKVSRDGGIIFNDMYNMLSSYNVEGESPVSEIFRGRGRKWLRHNISTYEKTPTNPLRG